MDAWASFGERAQGRGHWSACFLATQAVRRMEVRGARLMHCTDAHVRDGEAEAATRGVCSCQLAMVSLCNRGL